MQRRGRDTLAQLYFLFRADDVVLPLQPTMSDGGGRLIRCHSSPGYPLQRMHFEHAPHPGQLDGLPSIMLVL